jgi:hypothetical protein
MTQSKSIPSRIRIPQQYEFVPGLEKSYFGYIRAHVLKNHLVKRRKKGGRRRTNSGQDPVHPADDVEHTAGASTCTHTAVWSPEMVDPSGSVSFAAEEDCGDQAWQIAHPSSANCATRKGDRSGEALQVSPNNNDRHFQKFGSQAVYSKRRSQSPSSQQASLQSVLSIHSTPCRSI